MKHYQAQNQVYQDEIGRLQEIVKGHREQDDRDNQGKEVLIRQLTLKLQEQTGKAKGWKAQAEEERGRIEGIERQREEVTREKQDME